MAAQEMVKYHSTELMGMVYEGLEDDQMWTVAAIEVKAEKEGYMSLTPWEARQLQEYAVICNDDVRYPGILECQFENYESEG